ncbi:MAG TPA: carboxypeptidase-like regulatory domain-containing protein, partial [Candidatus Eremiobacteraceae bacterium]|nr:carboxypeptidase-like regulatory domain-containing protein [Candidatus Eremiobacteraceae bacterium]
MLALILGLALGPSAAFAQNESGQITIVVVDAASGKPIALSRVLLDGPIMTSELTRSDGKVVFRDTPAGVYTARAGKSGYQPVTTAAFEVMDGKAVEINVQLAVAASGVKSLGTVTVTSS